MKESLKDKHKDIKINDPQKLTLDHIYGPLFMLLSTLLSWSFYQIIEIIYHKYKNQNRLIYKRDVYKSKHIVILN